MGFFEVNSSLLACFDLLALVFDFSGLLISYSEKSLLSDPIGFGLDLDSDEALDLNVDSVSYTHLTLPTN